MDVLHSQGNTIMLCSIGIMLLLYLLNVSLAFLISFTSSFDFTFFNDNIIKYIFYILINKDVCTYFICILYIKLKLCENYKQKKQTKKEGK